MNPRAPIVECNMGNVDIKEVLDIRGFNLDSVLELDPDFLKEAHEEGEHHHHHEDGCTCGCHDHHDHDHGDHCECEDHDHDHVNAAITIIMLAMMTRLLLLYSSLTDRLTRPDSTIT